MIKKNKILQPFIFIILTVAGVYFSYQYIFQTWFAMDEWSFWMNFLRYGPFYVIKSTGFIGSLTGGIRFGLDLTNGIYFSLFGLNITPWHITFLALHLINIFLLYLILRKIKLSPISAFLASFYFAVASAGQEALSWPAAGMQVLGSTPFILLAVLLTLKFIDSRNKYFLFLAILFSYFSFLMRPTGIVTAALIAALIFLFYKRTNVLRLPRIVFVLGILIFTIGLIRLLIEYSDRLQIILLGGFNTIFYPLVSLSHIFIPYRLMFRLGDSFINFYYPIISNDINVNTISHLIVGDFISVVLSIFILIFIYLLYKRVNGYYKKVIVFALILFFLQYFVIALYYVDRGGLSYLASRHTYTSVAGISIILGVFFNLVLDKFKTSRSLKRYLYLALFLLVGVWLYQEMTVTRREVRAQAVDSIAIRKTYEALQSLPMINSNKAIFYIESDRNYFYPDWYLPFKLPSAYMMTLALYERSFIDESMLGELQTNNVYINSGNKQFGYFTDIELLISKIENNEININDVVGLYFIDGIYEFEITTSETKKIIEDKLNLNKND